MRAGTPRPGQELSRVRELSLGQSAVGAALYDILSGLGYKVFLDQYVLTATGLRRADATSS